MTTPQLALILAYKLLLIAGSAYMAVTYSPWWLLLLVFMVTFNDDKK